ncbi:MAG: sigma-70 family RNA polymerase sigma factor [Acidimicrobiales bacterium]
MRSNASDADLASAAAAGDDAAFNVLHLRYESLVRSVVRAEARGHRDTDDITQEVFARAWTKLPGLRDSALFRPWLLQITRRAIVDHYRHHARRPTLENDDDLALGALPSATAGPDEITELRDLARSVKSGIGGLSKRDATALSLAVHFGFGPTEIGEALSISPGNAKVVLHRARKRLRDAIELPHDTEGVAI